MGGVNGAALLLIMCGMFKINKTQCRNDDCNGKKDNEAKTGTCQPEPGSMLLPLLLLA